MALYKLIAAGTFPGESWTFGVHATGTLPIDTAADAWASASGDPFWVAMAPYICTDVEMNRATVVTLDEATGAQLQRRDRDVTRPGTSAAACLPFQVTPVVSLRSDDASRRGRGRFYVPSLAVDAQDGGRLTPAVQTELATAAAGMLLGLQAAGLTPVLLSRDTMATREITSVDVGDVMDTQRRRRNALIETRVSEAL